MSAAFGRIAIFGVGLLGGSVALAARQRGLAQQVLGVARRPETAQALLAAGIVDEALPAPGAAAGPGEALAANEASAASGASGTVGAAPAVDLAVLCTPVSAMARALQSGAVRLAEGALVTDVGSVKGPLCETLPGLLPEGVHYIGAHPMAGGHLGGWRRARAELFQGAACALTPAPDAPAAAVQRASDFWRGLGARVLLRRAERHDAEVAWISHAPHALAFAFARALAAAPAAAAELRGKGFRDFTRIARSDPALWADILVANRKALAGPLQAAADQLKKLARGIESGSAAAVEQFLRAAREQLAAAESTQTTSGDAFPQSPARAADEEHLPA